MAIGGDRRAAAWLRAGTRVIVVSKDDALENTVELLRRSQITASFFTPACIASISDIRRKLGETQSRLPVLTRGPGPPAPFPSVTGGSALITPELSLPTRVPAAPALAQPWLPASIS
jgi:hypothetical protein